MPSAQANEDLFTMPLQSYKKEKELGMTGQLHTINGDMAERVVIDTREMDWSPSPSSTMLRKRLHLVGDVESGQVTTFVRYLPGSSFPEHDHPEGEEIFVLKGTFSDHQVALDLGGCSVYFAFHLSSFGALPFAFIAASSASSQAPAVRRLAHVCPDGKSASRGWKKMERSHFDLLPF
jgi:hypothetical protein